MVLRDVLTYGRCMALGGDPDRLRDLARDLRREAGELEQVRIRVMNTPDSEWTGSAGERYRDRIVTYGLDLDGTKDGLHDTARAMDDLAQTLQERQRAIAIAMSSVMGALRDAESTINRFAGMLLDSLTDSEKGLIANARAFLDRTPDLPAEGDPEWTAIAKKLGV